MAAILPLQADENNVKAMGLTHVTARFRNLAEPNGGYEADFLLTQGQPTRLRQPLSCAKPAFNRLAGLHMNSPTVDWKSMSLDSPKSVSWTKLRLAASSSGLTMSSHFWAGRLWNRWHYHRPSDANAKAIARNSIKVIVVRPTEIQIPPALP